MNYFGDETPPPILIKVLKLKKKTLHDNLGIFLKLPVQKQYLKTEIMLKYVPYLFYNSDRPILIHLCVCVYTPPGLVPNI